MFFHWALPRKLNHHLNYNPTKINSEYLFIFACFLIIKFKIAETSLIST